MTFTLSDTAKMTFVCPECSRNLQISDVETYHACPYCEHKFKNDQKFQDFLDSLVIHAWENVEYSEPFVLHMSENESNSETNRK